MQPQLVVKMWELTLSQANLPNTNIDNHLGLITALLREILCTPYWKPEANSIVWPQGDTVEIERLDVKAGQPVTFDRVSCW